MIKYIIVLILIVSYEIYKMKKNNNFENISVFILFVTVASMLLYVSESKIFGDSLAEIVFRFINTDYTNGS